ncbi:MULTISPECIES: hypothetical protein [unclassified Gordonia (in: high G+C Gram-positive bacteria)]|uniref:hypothetical protein n=1 Tax=unclassified Gordonia (in: high G+C Gram-positive bacteria) TaxID=2657482 RepID=UPI001FFFF784|nr:MULTISPECIES: hypothetical protein [unclassified Gordonia (in: high G+C Gram-positive bacteria)]UQE75411.1 hypothetical protein MYK68_01945 [Gordonia sp. PP30]
MSAPVLPAKDIDPSLPGVPFGRLAAVELRKLLNTRSTWILLGLLGVIWLITLLILAFMRTPTDFATSVRVFGMMTPTFVGIVTIMLVTSEWGQRSVLSTFTLEPRRERVVAAKFCAAFGLALALFIAYVALAAIIAGARGASFDSSGPALRFSGVNGLFELLMAFAMALALLNTAGGIVVYLIVPSFIVPTVLTVGSLASGGLDEGGKRTVFDSIADWISPSTAFDPLSHPSAGAETWAHVLVCFVLWVGIPGVLGIWRVMTTEVK